MLWFFVSCMPDVPLPSPTFFEEAACGAVQDGEWTLINGGDSLEEPAPILLEAPYQVSLREDQVNYVTFTMAEPGSVTVLTDRAGAVTEVWSPPGTLLAGQATRALACEQDLPNSTTVDLAAGDVVIGLGPLFQASVWLYAFPCAYPGCGTPGTTR